MTSYLWLLPVGALIGAFGTLVGAGGGLSATPLLLLVYPHESPEIITSISLAIGVFQCLLRLRGLCTHAADRLQVRRCSLPWRRFPALW
jgi:uncharacterized membrane protein YfcA